MANVLMRSMPIMRVENWTLYGVPYDPGAIAQSPFLNKVGDFDTVTSAERWIIETHKDEGLAKPELERINLPMTGGDAFHIVVVGTNDFYWMRPNYSRDPAWIG